jgi:hypothetical protein
MFSKWLSPSRLKGIRETAATDGDKRVKVSLFAIGLPSGRWCTMREEFASFSYPAVTVAGLVLLCSRLLAHLPNGSYWPVDAPGLIGLVYARRLRTEDAR